jgi:rRNA maturation endonuclease Nob1
MGNRFGFLGNNKRIYLQRCPICKKENYAMNVSSGMCTWCGHKATLEDIGEKEKDYSNDC